MSTYREHAPTESDARLKRSSQNEKAAEYSQLHDDVKKTKATCEDIQDTIHRFVGLEAKLDKLQREGEEASALEDRIEVSEHWRRIGQLEGELQKAKEGEQEARAKLIGFDKALAEVKAKEMLALADIRKELQEVRRERDQAIKRLEGKDGELKHMAGELQSRKDAICSMEHKSAERSSELGFECSNHTQKVRELECASEVLKKRNRSLEDDVGKLMANNQRLEQKLNSALEGGKTRHLINNHAVDDDTQQKALHDVRERELEQHFAELEDARQQFEQQVKEFKAHDRSAQIDKENKKLREMVQEQKRSLSDLESELRQESNVASLPTPKDYLRLVKLQEGEGFSRQNARHMIQKKSLEKDMEVCQQALARHLTPASKASVRKEFQGIKLLF